MLLGLLLFCACHEENENTITCRDEEPAWSPDGQYIAYFHDPNDIYIPPYAHIINALLCIGCTPYSIADEDRRSGIWLMELATMEAQFLTEGSLPDWSPDGKWIAYVKDRDIHKINVETQETQQLSNWGSCFFPDWAADGDLLAFDCTIGNPDSSGIWIMKLTDGSAKHIGLGREPSWNPNCNKIAYTGRSAEPGHHEYDIWIVDITGGDTLCLTNTGGRSPVFSPDGSHIVYSSNCGSEGINIYVIDTSGLNEVQLTDVGWAIDPSWSPDGSQIVFSQWDEKANATSLWVMNSDGSRKRRITWPDN
ncbi:PD40 domain-containing protein [candidate division WOR-3 bacterium]|nr:PD40 domain-containing protein [candidate division WOR-3 bacterium]